MPASAPSDLRFPLAVAAHDAGAANLIAGWLRDVPTARWRVCATGPAARIFATEFPAAIFVPLETALDGAALLLSGTSGPHTDLEHQARRAARRAGIASVGVIDHWINYAPRFCRDNETVLPDEIWVTDSHAAALARRVFPHTPVRQQPNRYLEALTAQVRAIPRTPSRALHVLYVLEPMRTDWGRDGYAGEFQALEFFLAHAESLGLGTNVEIRLRPHPSDPAGKYDAWLARRADARLTLDVETPLAAAIGWSDWVVGCESYAMVVGLAAERRVVSSLPPWAPACRLPHPPIARLREIVADVATPLPSLACR